MSDVRSRRAQPEQSLDLGVSVVRSEVEVQAILRRLRLRDRHEEESRKPIRGGSDLELLGVVVHDNPAERVSPPESEGTRVARINDRLLPLKAHEPIVEELLPRVPRNAGSWSHRGLSGGRTTGGGGPCFDCGVLPQVRRDDARILVLSVLAFWGLGIDAALTARVSAMVAAVVAGVVFYATVARMHGESLFVWPPMRRMGERTQMMINGRHS